MLAAEILGEVTKQDKQKVQGSAKSLLDEVLKEIGQESDNVDVDILTYVRAPWGLHEDPYPIQRFMLKVINGIALDDRPDSEVIEVIDELTIRVERTNQFDNPGIVDVGENIGLRVDSVDPANHTITFKYPPLIPLKVGDFITGRILIWDKFRENITGAYTESEFLTFLYGDGPGSENCRINVNLEEYLKRVESKSVMNLIILRIGRRGTKCLNKNTLCTTNKGFLSLSEIQEDGVTDLEVPNGIGQLKTVSLLYDNGKAKTLKIKTSLGTEIEGTSEHKLWVMSSKGTLEWRKLQDLKVGDWTTLSRKNNGCFGDPKEFSITQFELWGVYYGDGCVTEAFKTSISLQTSTKNGERELYENLLESVLGSKPTWTPDKRKGKRTGRLSVNGGHGKGIPITDCIRFEWERLGLGYNLKETQLPRIIRTASKDQLAGFLRGWFEADGCASGSRKLYLSLKNEELSKQVQIILLGFGISSIRRQDKIEDEIYWRVEIRTNRDRTRFMEEIGFLSKRKIDAGWETTKSPRETDFIPCQEEVLKEYQKSLRTYGAHRDPHRSLFRIGQSFENLSLSRIQEIQERFPQEVSLRQHFVDLMEADYVYTQVTSIEDSEAETLDLSVPDGRTYVAAGHVTHNTTISQWMAAYNAYKVLRKYYPQQYYRTRRDQAISMTLIATGKEQAQDLLAPARSAMKRSPYLRRFVVADSERRLTLNTPYNMDNGLDAENGLKIIAAPCSAKSVRGPANILVLLEEYGMFYYELAGSNKSDMAIYEAISPSLADLTDPKTGKPAGTMMIISTPLTRESHMYRLEQQIWDKHDDLGNSLILHLPSYWTNRLLSSEKLRAEYAVDPLYFRQEFEAYYSDQRQLALKREEIEGCCQLPGPNDFHPLPTEQCFMGFDLGLKNDPTAIVVVAVNAKGHARIVHEEIITVREEDAEFIDYEAGGDVLDIFKVAQRVDEVWKEYRCRKGMGDQWNAMGFRPLLKTDAKTNLDFADINSTINDRIAKNFLAYIYQRNLTIYASQEHWEDKLSLVRELARLQRVETSGMMTKIKIEAPNLAGAHDDRYSALSRALWIAQQSIAEMPPVVLTMHQTKGKAAQTAMRRETMQRQKQHAAMLGRSPKGQTRRFGK